MNVLKKLMFFTFVMFLVQEKCLASGLKAAAPTANTIFTFLKNPRLDVDQAAVDVVKEYIMNGGDPNAADYNQKPIVSLTIQRLASAKNKGPLLNIIKWLVIGGIDNNELQEAVNTLGQTDKKMVVSTIEFAKRELSKVKPQIVQPKTASSDAVSFLDKKIEARDDSLIDFLKRRIKLKSDGVYSPAYYQHALMKAISIPGNSSYDDNLINFLINEVPLLDKSLIDIHADNEAALRLAIEKLNYSAIKLLLKKGADPIRGNIFALFKNEKPASFEIEEIIDLLNNVNVKDSDGKTMLHYAVKQSWSGAVSKLIARQADINAQDNNGDTPLLLLSQLPLPNRFKDIIKMLVTSGADLSIKNKQDESFLTKILHNLIELYFTNSLKFNELAQALEAFRDTKQGAAFFQKETSKENRLFIAVINSQLEDIKKFVKAGALVDTTFYKNLTPLMIAAVKGFPLTVDTLIDLGASIDAQDSEGNTALTLAAQASLINTTKDEKKEYSSVIKQLLANGASVELGNTNFLMLMQNSKFLKDIYLSYKIEKAAPKAAG